ncbi:hypothetical protein V7O61_04800 [Methanolobus sp. WCC1]|uniref:coiled-coil domain-containing protein n=1 Tax=unclassified Methanolobus TaxID=2629569 RepID=UPI00324F559D
MKAKSKEIKTYLEDENNFDLNEVNKKILDSNFTQEHNEYDINEAIADFQYIKDILIQSIDEGILDTYSFNTRTNLLKNLNHVQTHINNIINANQNSVPTLLDNIQNLKNLVFLNLNLDLKVKTLVDYEKKRNELMKIQIKYNSLLLEIERASELYEKTKEQIQEFNNNVTDSKKLVGQHNALDKEMQQKNREITNISNQINTLFNQVNSQSNLVNDFATTVKEQSKKLEESETKTNLIIQNNEELEQKITDLLSSAVGGALGKTFGERKAELKKEVHSWKWWTLLSIGFLFIAAGAVYFEILSGINETTTLISKIALLIPASAAVWFAASNYNRERKLLEEYAFKSSISLSLDSYRKVLNEELDDKERDKIAGFLIASMDKIYSSPLENISKHSPKDGDIEVSAFERIMNSVSHIIK